MAFDIHAYIGSVMGLTVDPDHWSPGECVDLADDYAEKRTGLPWPTAIGGVRGAENLMEVAPTTGYWEAVWNGPDNYPGDGDLVIWSSSWNGNYGHVALSAGSDAWTVRGAESNVAGRFVSQFSRGYEGVRGWLRYIGPDAQSAAAAPSSFEWWQVDPGDTLSGIAERNGTSTDELIRLNPELRTNPDLLQTGYVLSLTQWGADHFEQNPWGAVATVAETSAAKPAGPQWNWWQVDPGDTLSGIAQTNGITVARIVELNPELADHADLIQPGYVLSLTDWGAQHFEQNPWGVPAFSEPTFNTRPEGAKAWLADVSNYQTLGVVQAAKDAGVDGLILRAGAQGASYGGKPFLEDAKMSAFLQEAKRLGVQVVAVYWQGYTTDSATDEAECANRVLAGLDVPVIALTETAGGEAASGWLEQFCQALTHPTVPMIYGNEGNLPRGRWAEGKRQWFANYSVQPGSRGDLHQYTGNGRLRGYDGDVDLSASMTMTVEELFAVPMKLVKAEKPVEEPTASVVPPEKPVVAEKPTEKPTKPGPNWGVVSSSVLTLATAIFPLLAAFGVKVSGDQVSAILAFLPVLFGAIAVVAGTTTTTNTAVVEKTADGRSVFAGDANELATGVLVRDNLGEKR